MNLKPIIKKFSLLSFALIATSYTSCAVENSASHVGTFECVSTDGTYTLNYPKQVSSGLPCNVDTKAVNSVNSIAKEQRYFDIFSWQSFIALNWPTTNNGQTLQKSFTDKGKPSWNYWKESYEVFRDNGVKPMEWGVKSKPQNICTNIPNIGNKKILFRANKLNHLASGATVADELDQAFTYPLIDQNGNLVRYEVLMNYDEFNYITTNELYNIDGQINYTGKEGNNINFPKGDNPSKNTGAIELKMAWKVMTPTDPINRYYTEPALIANQDGTCEEVEVGLIGVHFSHKTVENKQWIWATFEQVDNVRTNQLKEVKLKNGEMGELRPSFNNPDCPSCPVNVLETDKNGNYTPVQVIRVIPIDKNTEELNHQVQAILRDMGSVFQYYELVGTQWPTDESVPPTSPSQFSTKGDSTYEQIANKSGGKPHPVYLVNSIMETFMQYGNQKAQLQIQGFPFNETPVFGTESCIGCHYSSGVAISSMMSDGQKQAIYAPAGSGDFSWLLQLKAQWKK